MATAIYPLNKIQLGIESAKGTLVAATRLIQCDGEAMEEQDFYRSGYPQGVRANAGGAGVITRKGFGIKIATELTAEEILWPLLTGVRGAVAPTNHGGGSALTGTANVAVTTSSTTLADSRVTWVVNEWIGATVTCDGKTGVVTSNTSTTLTVGAWVGGTPTTGSAWSIVALDYLWTFTPQLTTGIPTIDAATIEAMRSDGSTNHYYAEAGYGITSAFEAEWAFNQTGKLGWDMFARARQSDTPTGALSVYSSREELVTPLLSTYLDTSYASMGNTQLTGITRSAKLAVSTGFAPNYTMDGRADRDFVNHKVGNITAKLSLLMELDAVGAARFTAFRSNALQYIRLKNTGGLIGGRNKYVQMDGAFRYTGAPAISRDGEQMLVACELESVYDVTGTKTLEFSALNGLAAVA